MGFSYKDLAKKTKKAHLDLDDGDRINFAFRHQLITPRLVADLSALDGMREDSPAEVSAKLLGVSEHVARLLTEWDVTEADGTTMFPLVADRLAEDIPLEIQMRLLMACVNEMQGNGSSQGNNAGEAPAAAA